MDVLNFISWLKSKKQVTTVDASQTLIPLGLKDPRRGDGYIPGAISVEDFASSVSPSWGSIQGNIYSQSDLQNQFSGKQDTLYSGSNIKTINGNSVLGSGNIVAGAPSFLESDSLDKTIWNNGKGDVTSSTTFGEGSLRSNTSGIDNTAYGYYALSSNTTGIRNTAVGRETLKSLTTGFRNTAIGKGAGINITTGYSNIAIGLDTLSSLTTGNNNIAIGNDALNVSTTSTDNIAIGSLSLVNIASGQSNIGIGLQAIRSCTTGNGNLGFGMNALYATTSGDSNIGIGKNALQDNTTGNENIAIGNFTNSINFSKCIILGNNANPTADNQFVVGSITHIAGSVVTAAQTQTKYWNVIINGVAQRILLA